MVLTVFQRFYRFVLLEVEQVLSQNTPIAILTISLELTCVVPKGSDR